MYRLSGSNKRRFGVDERRLHDYSRNIRACLPEEVRDSAEQLKRIERIIIAYDRGGESQKEVLKACDFRPIESEKKCDSRLSDASFSSSSSPVPSSVSTLESPQTPRPVTRPVPASASKYSTRSNPSPDSKLIRIDHNQALQIVDYIKQGNHRSKSSLQSNSFEVKAEFTMGISDILTGSQETISHSDLIEFMKTRFCDFTSRPGNRVYDLVQCTGRWVTE